MRKEVSISVSPEVAAKEDLLKKEIFNKNWSGGKIISFVKILKHSIDARSKTIKVNINAEIYFDENPPEAEIFSVDYPNVANKKHVIIIGCGPSGMFSALRLIELGYKPIIFERGKDVQSRRRDLVSINRDHIVNPDSNYCFGEGGAGTYSDGKLYTRSTKKGDVKKILKIFVSHGAPEKILFETHPHIGTNKLPEVVQAMRQSILNSGGEIHFNSRIVDFTIKENRISGIITLSGEKIDSEAFILATGHSARDIFEILQRKKILIEPKPFAMGVRVEHPQELIDSVQYHLGESEEDGKIKFIKRSQYLPAAAYSLVHQADGRGVYSFCMCPGGFIVPSATAPGEIVVNGMSPSKRDSKYANSGIVVSIHPGDEEKFAGAGDFAGLMFQKELEKMAFEAGGYCQSAPGQRLIDFCNNKFSSTLPDCSYQPGVKSAPLHELLPPFISKRLQDGFRQFGKKMKRYFTNEALILGVESRTSSPIRIPRDKNSLQHVQIKNLFPCGEGAGFAGGIISAAIDGELSAEAVVRSIR